MDEWEDCRREATKVRQEMIGRYQRMKPGVAKSIMGKLIDWVFWIERVAKNRGYF